MTCSNVKSLKPLLQRTQIQWLVRCPPVSESGCCRFSEFVEYFANNLKYTLIKKSDVYWSQIWRIIVVQLRRLIFLWMTEMVAMVIVPQQVGRLCNCCTFVILWWNDFFLILLSYIFIKSVKITLLCCWASEIFTGLMNIEMKNGRELFYMTIKFMY